MPTRIRGLPRGESGVRIIYLRFSPAVTGTTPETLDSTGNLRCYRVSTSQRRGRRTGQECPCRARVGFCNFQGGGTDAPQRESRVRKAPTHLEHARRTPYVRTGGHARRHVRGSIYGLRAGRHRHASGQRHRLERRRRPGRDRHRDRNTNQQQPHGRQQRGRALYFEPQERHLHGRSRAAGLSQSHSAERPRRRQHDDARGSVARARTR